MKFLPIPKLTESDLNRFWSKVNKQNSEGCWEWTGSKSVGYGRFGIGNHIYSAHRISYAIDKGDPGEICVCHTCDNPPCVNPEHLWLGTHSENMRDCKDKNRSAHGRQNGKAKLTNRQVEEILASNSVYRVLAIQYGVCQMTISNIKTGRYWERIKGIRHKTILYANSTTGVRGVCFHKRVGKFQARIAFKGKEYALGYFNTLRRAEQAIVKKRRELRA